MRFLFIIFMLFFFYHKTAYEWLISVWSSVLCSSDLASEVTCEPEDPGAFASMLVSPLLVLSGVSRSLTFWILFGAFIICGATTSGLVQTHLIAICGDFGITSVMAAGMLAAIGAFNLVGTIGSGWLSDRFDSRWLLFWYYGLRG